jgi:hypothetical protein
VGSGDRFKSYGHFAWHVGQVSCGVEWAWAWASAAWPSASSSPSLLPVPARRGEEPSQPRAGGRCSPPASSPTTGCGSASSSSPWRALGRAPVARVLIGG